MIKTKSGLHQLGKKLSIKSIYNALHWYNIGKIGFNK